MKRFFATPLLLLALIMASCHKEEEKPDIAIFCNSIASIASQEGISFADAASRVRDIGYTGVDVWVTQDSAQIAVIDSLGFKHASAISMIRYSDDKQNKTEKKTLEFMKEYGFDKVLLVPGLLPEDASQEHIDSVRKVIAAFAKNAREERLTVMVEDYDDPSSVCYNSKLLDTLFRKAPELGMTFDTGNFLYAGEDCLKALSGFAPNVCHVHLKDRISSDNFSCPAPGTGCIPVRDIIKSLLLEGYDGWFTVELSTPNMLEDAATAYRNVSETVLEYRLATKKKLP